MQFQAPRNFKQGRLIFSRFRPIDLAFFIGTTLFSVLAIIIYCNSFEEISVAVVLILFIPCALGFTLTLPAGLYHNSLVLLAEAIRFFTTSHTYVWEGIYKDDGKYEE